MLVNAHPDFHTVNRELVQDLVEPWLVGNGTAVSLQHSTLLSIPQNIIGVNGAMLKDSWTSRLTVVVTASKGWHLIAAD